MIGILCADHEREIARELFELFKTPWEFCAPGREYDTVLCSTDRASDTIARLLVIYGSGANSADAPGGIGVEPSDGERFLSCEGERFPLYRESAVISGGRALLRYQDGTVAAAEVAHSPVRVIRAGFNLFAEVEHLLTVGQPSRFASTPTLDLHIETLRSWILQSGIPLLEIPPSPDGYSCIACLTHDVDFIRIRQHVFGPTLLGFLYRASVGSLARYLRGDLNGREVLRNWAAILKTPLVCLGLAKDFWMQFDRYMKIERETRSTFFLIPFSKQITDRIYPPDVAKRATRYDVSDIADEIRKLRAGGYEVGVHGVEAYSSIANACRELERVGEFTGDKGLGVRMHFLKFSPGSPRSLEAAGYLYDSTCGYNDVVGYRAGTAQAFRYPGTERLIELPMLIHDMAMFSSRRQRLSNTQARSVCERVLNHVARRGGAVTTLWHMRSIAPERLWDGFYLRLLSDIRSRGAWFGTARQVTDWFRKRRSARFEEVGREPGLFRVRLRTEESDGLPALAIRLQYRPDPALSVTHTIVQPMAEYLEIPWGDHVEPPSISVFPPNPIQI